MGIKGRFLKLYINDIKSFSDSDLTETDRKTIEIDRSGAYFIYKLMYRRLIRKNWKDHFGFPLKKKFYNKNFLVCSISIRKLAIESGFGDQKIQKLINQLEDIGWIVKENNHTQRRQTVFTLGTWGTRKILRNGDYVNEYYEELYSHSKQEEFAKGFSLEDIYGDNFELEFQVQQ